MNDRWVLVFRHGAMVEIVEEEYEGATDIAALWDTGIGLLKKTQRIDAIYHQEDIDQGSMYYATCQPERSVTYTLILPASLIEKLEQNQLPVEALAERLQQQEQAIPWFIIDPEENIFYS